MLEIQNHDGLIAFLLGMIFLVLSGVGFSLVADRVGDSGVAYSEIRSQLGQQEEMIRKLRLELRINDSKLRESRSLRAEQLERIWLAQLSEDAVRSRYEDLSRLKAELAASVSETRKSFQDHRIKMREMARTRAIGDSLGKLTTRNGRIFDDALVVGVHDNGISIRHSAGTASIPATELTEAYWEMFHWERPDLMPMHTISHDPASLHKGHVLKDEKDIATLRAVLKRAGENVSRASHQLREISEVEAYPKSPSDQGIMETWMKRKAQLTSDLANAQMEFAKARANLMIRSPNDPQLTRERIPWGF